MIYRAIGIMSGSSLDGLDIAFVELVETAGRWTHEILHCDCVEYNEKWTKKLQQADLLTAKEYQLLHAKYGRYIGTQVNNFIQKHGLEHKVNLIASHGHTIFHLPQQQMTAQIGDGATIAAITGISVVSDLRNLDIALGGQGAPIVPIGEKLLFAGYDYFLNIGGIANISINTPEGYIAFDVCAANRVLNMLAAENSLQYDDKGEIAASGKLNAELLTSLNMLGYYNQPYPKSLANSFGINIIYPILKNSGAPLQDRMRTYVEHITLQIKNAVASNEQTKKMLVTGGGAFNTFLIERLKTLLAEKNIELVIPDEKTIQYKEALIMALMGVLRWREEENVLPSVTGAKRGSVGGALWIG